MPLSFIIVGVHGMSFVNIAELRWRFGGPCAWSALALFALAIFRRFSPQTLV